MWLIFQLCYIDSFLVKLTLHLKWKPNLDYLWIISAYHCFFFYTIVFTFCLSIKMCWTSIIKNSSKYIFYDPLQKLSSGIKKCLKSSIFAATQCINLRHVKCFLHLQSGRVAAHNRAKISKTRPKQLKQPNQSLLKNAIDTKAT